jgi:nucleotide-binding universal stress UspA family protein
MQPGNRYSSAVMDFKRARRQAAIQEVIGRLGRKPQRLVPFEEIRRRLGTDNYLPRRLEEIPLDSIIGSVGRYEDFDRHFLPRYEAQRGRWANVRIAVEEQGLPPIEVYKLGDVYFVLDGHHRVSVARQVGAKSIEAYVIEIPTTAPLSPEDDVDQLICKAEQAGFIRDTHIDKLRPDIDFTVTIPGCYRPLREHIAVHRYYLSREQGREIGEDEAVQSWVDRIYLPAVEAIRRRGLLRDFPDRTETDLYLWLTDHRSQLTASLGWELEPDEAASSLGQRFSRTPRRIWQRFSAFLRDIFTPDTLETGPPPGEWRAERAGQQRLFGRILVAVSGEPESWKALEQAIVVAGYEGGTVRGLHVAPKRSEPEASAPEEIEGEFDRRLAEAGVPGRLVYERGEIARSVELRARWSDLVVLHLKHPPGLAPMERLRSGMRLVVQRMPRPVLVVPEVTEMKHALLAFDGSRKAREALYLAAHAAQHWGVSLTVLTNQEDEKDVAAIQAESRDYLDKHGVEADYVEGEGEPGEAVIETLRARGCDFILMGGYGVSPLVEVVLGSTVDHVLRSARVPILICR